MAHTIILRQRMSGFHCRIVGFQASESRFPIFRNAGFRRPGHWCHEARNTHNSQFMEQFGNPITNDRGWDYVLLPELAEFVLGSTPKSSEPEYWDGDVKWITPAELEDTSFVIYDSVRHITEAGVKAAGLKPFPAGTVIFSTRAPIGKTAIAGCDMYCNQGFKNLICGPRLNPVYLFSVLRMHKEA